VYLDLKVIYDIIKHQKKIKRGIRKYGHFAEHNYLHYLHNETKWDKNVFFDFGNDRSILAQYYEEGNVWSLFPNGILALKNERLDLLLEAANYILKKQKSKKFIVEVSEDLRKEILNKFKIKNSFRACAADVLYWPMYNMDLWNSRLKGSKWKKLRNISNRFYRRNRVSVRNSKDVPKEELNKILSSWLKKRKDSDRVDKDYYFNLINDNFKGLDMAKTMYVNGKPCTITAGWKIPNSNNYYSSIGILDYSYLGLGEVANIDDLNRLKRKGYDYVDFGGSDKVLLYFKKKFRPEKIYKTYIFSIVKS
jgi:hypothetical protein